MRRSGCFVTHTVSLKRFFFFFSNKSSAEEPEGFPKSQQNRTAHNTISQRSVTSSEIPVSQKTDDTRIHYPFMLRPAPGLRGGGKWMQRSQQDKARQLLSRRAASLQVSELPVLLHGDWPHPQECLSRRGLGWGDPNWAVPLGL